MSAKKKKMIFAVASIVVILAIAVFWGYSQAWFQGGYGATGRENLEKYFRESFEESEYTAISHAQKGNTIVYLGETGGTGRYVIFRKMFLLNRWNRIDRQTMESNNHPMLISDPAWGRIYLSLNDREITKAVVIKDGKETEISVDPEKPMVVITDYEIDQITFLTQNDQEISEEDFLNSTF